MKVTLLVTGETGKSFLKEGIELYSGRLRHYIDFNIEVIPDIRKTKNTPVNEQKKREGQRILAQMNSTRQFHLLDEKGKAFHSRGFAAFLEKKMVSGLKELVFVIGGPYGFSEELKGQAASKISLSPMTFSHQLARLLFVEQLYRAMTILKGESYHND